MSQKCYLRPRNSCDSQPGCAIMFAMRFLPKLGSPESWACNSEDEAVTGEMGDTKAKLGEDSNLLKTVGWISAALGAVALGLIVGRELRLRYKFNRRTPYDLYSHSGDELPDVDCGVGI
jgi:hypothetical protein